MSGAPAEAFPVGPHLQQVIEARGWTQTEFAEVINRPAQAVSEIISGKKEITRESAAQIAAAFGMSPDYWLSYQDQYHLWKQAQDASTLKQLDDVRLRARLNELAPMAVLRKRGIITATALSEQAEQLCELLEMKTLNDEPALAMVARRSNTDQPVTPVQQTWLACVKQRATEIQVAAYSPDKLIALASNMSRDVRDPAGFAILPAKFAEAGVRLVHIEAFPSSKIDGASFEMADTPVIGISGRGQRLDKVLFTILHECGHIVLGHTKHGPIIDVDSPHGKEREDQANEAAAKWVLDTDLPPAPDRINQSWLTAAALQMSVHPAVIVGRLQHEGRLSWRSALIKDAPNVTEFLHSW